jgi:hypothetical protein
MLQPTHLLYTLPVLATFVVQRGLEGLEGMAVTQVNPIERVRRYAVKG